MLNKINEQFSHMPKVGTMETYSIVLHLYYRKVGRLFYLEDGYLAYVCMFFLIYDRWTYSLQF